MLIEASDVGLLCSWWALGKPDPLKYLESPIVLNQMHYGRWKVDKTNMLKGKRQKQLQEKGDSKILPWRWSSNDPRGMYSYTSSRWSPSAQYPVRFTRLGWCKRLSIRTSTRNSLLPWRPFLSNCLTATTCKHQCRFIYSGLNPNKKWHATQPRQIKGNNISDLLQYVSFCETEAYVSCVAITG